MILNVAFYLKTYQFLESSDQSRVTGTRFIFLHETPTTKREKKNRYIWRSEHQWETESSPRNKKLESRPWWLHRPLPWARLQDLVQRENTAEPGKLHEPKGWGWACKASRQTGFAGREEARRRGQSVTKEAAEDSSVCAHVERSQEASKNLRNRPQED